MMDILVGGIPRSGTTALARSLALHPDVFCWSSETGLLPTVDALTRGFLPRAANALQCKQLLFRLLSDSMIRMRRWNADGAELTGVLSFDDISELVEQTTAIMVGARTRASILDGCAAVLRRFFAERSPRAVIAEKTPSNLLLFGESAGVTRKWLATHREPFAVLASMAQRVGKPWPAAFEGSLERRIGLYLSHAEKIKAGLSDRASFLALSYDRLCVEQNHVAESICTHLALPRPPDFGDAIANIVSGEPRRDAWTAFAPSDRWKVVSLLRDAQADLGYDESYYGVSFAAMIDGAGPPQAGVEPLYGIGSLDVGAGGRWAQDRAALAVYAPAGFDTLDLTIYNCLDRLGAGDGASTYAIAAHCYRPGGALLPLDRLDLAAGRLQTWRIELGKAEPIGRLAGVRLYDIRLRSNLAYTPACVLPSSDDERNLSYLIAAWALSGQAIPFVTTA